MFHHQQHKKLCHSTATKFSVPHWYWKSSLGTIKKWRTFTRETKLQLDFRAMTITKLINMLVSHAYPQAEFKLKYMYVHENSSVYNSPIVKTKRLLILYFFKTGCHFYLQCRAKTFPLLFLSLFEYD